MEKNKQDLPYDLRPSRSGPAVLKGLFPTQSSLDGVQYVIFALLFDKFCEVLSIVTWLYSKPILC